MEKPLLERLRKAYAGGTDPMKRFEALTVEDVRAEAAAKYSAKSIFTLDEKNLHTELTSQAGYLQAAVKQVEGRRSLRNECSRSSEWSRHRASTSAAAGRLSTAWRSCGAGISDSDHGEDRNLRRWKQTGTGSLSREAAALRWRAGLLPPIIR